MTNELSHHSHDDSDASDEASTSATHGSDAVDTPAAEQAAPASDGAAVDTADVDDSSEEASDTWDTEYFDEAEDEEDSDTEDVDDESTHTLVVEHIAPELSRKSLLMAGGIAVAVSLAVTLLPGVFSGNPEPVGVHSVEVAGGADVSDNETAPGVAEAMKSVYRIDSGHNTGSSFLVNKDTLATNAHVATADVGDTVKVTTPDGDSFDGEVLMRDESVDLALVKVPEQDNKPLPLLSVREQEVGQGAYLAGYPLSLDLTLTTGIVSAVDTVTNLRESAGQHSLLQIDAAVNPGSSGGPVLDENGRVMGIATSRPDSVGGRGIQGIAFAIPANDVSIAINQYNEHGDVQYGYLGVSYESHSNAIRSVTPNTPADAAGLKEGDIIRSVNGFETPDYTAVSRHMHVYRPGEEVELKIKRGDKTEDVQVVLGEPR